MIVTLLGQSVELEATVVWALPGTREAATLDCVIPRGHSVYRSTAWSEQPGWPIATGDLVLGQWQGIVTDVEVTAEGARIAAVDLAAIVAKLPVSAGRTFDSMPAALLAHLAITDALGSSAGLGVTEGGVAYGGSVIPTYELRGQPLGEVLGDLGERSGQEWRVQDGKLAWRGASGIGRPVALVEGGTLTSVSRTVAARESVASVTAVGTNGVAVTARAYGAAARWGNRQTITVAMSDPAGLQLAADARLAQLNEPVVTYTGKLDASLWSYREGDQVTIVAPQSGGLDGEVCVARITKRSFDGTQLTITAQRLSVSRQRSSVARAVVVPREGDYIRRLVDLKQAVDAI